MQLSLLGLLLLTQPLHSLEQHTRANLEFSSNFVNFIAQISAFLTGLKKKSEFIGFEENLIQFLNNKCGFLELCLLNQIRSRCDDTFFVLILKELVIKNPTVVNSHTNLDEKPFFCASIFDFFCSKKRIEMS